MIESFVHLRVHSHYTLSRGASKIDALIDQAVKFKQPALALVDEGNMYAALDFSKAASAKGIQPIIGTKLWLDIGESKKGSVSLIAQSPKGYARVCSLLAAAHRPHGDNEGGSQILPAAELEGDNEGVVVLTGGQDGVLKRLIEEGRNEDAKNLFDYLRYCYGNGLYVELTRFGDESAKEIEVENKLVDLAYNSGEIEAVDGSILQPVPLVATSECWYATPDRHDAFEILKAVNTKEQLPLLNDNVVARSDRRYHLRSTKEMKQLFADLPEAFENALLLAQRCAFKAEPRDPILPPFKTEGGRSEAEELRAQSIKGLNERLEKLGISNEARKQYDERLEYELGIIEGMQFPGYFLIVSDFIKWSKEQGIPVGPGRGSGAGSLVAYSLQITDLDPLRFGLLFERFLNPERVSMPDFDIDFCQDRREEVIDYVCRKYGTEYVSLIATFGEIKSKMSLKDVGRVVQSDDFGGFNFLELNELSKLVSMKGPVPLSIEQSYKDKDNPDFKTKVDSAHKYKVLCRHASTIEGLFRSQGAHAAGVIIAGQPIQQLVPVGWDNDKNMPVSQFNMKAAETSGLVKFDFLGLKTLSVIRETLEHIKQTTGEDIDLSSIDLHDPATFNMIAKGRTNGIFQFESDGMKKWLRALQPNRFEDLIAMTSLYRPGPMDYIPNYVNRKTGEEEAEYPEPVDQTKPFLEETFGIMVYQEQVMQVAQVVAGYSLGGADILRRAMGKKIPEEMEKQKITFVEGAVKNGHDENDAAKLFDVIAKFAGYGFNKSHAAAYSLISYHTAWLKCHYPAEFLSALMTYEMSSTDAGKRMAKIKEDMDHLGIKMLPPSVNHSFPRFKPERDEDGVQVRFGLGAIKGVSGAMIKMLDARREKLFDSLLDFHKRAGGLFNKGQIENLAAAGAFETIAPNRRAAFDVLCFLAKEKKDPTDQGNLFGNSIEADVPSEISGVEEWGNKVDREFNAVGFYFGAHPLDAYIEKLKAAHVKRFNSLRIFMIQNSIADLPQKRLAGLVEWAERRTSKRTGKPFVCARIAEKSETFTVNFFSRDEESKLDRIRVKLENAKDSRVPVVIIGDVVLREGNDMSIFGNEVVDANELLSADRGPMMVRVDQTAILPDPTEQRKMRDINERLRIKTISEEAAEKERNAIKHQTLMRKCEQVHAIAARLRQDENPSSVSLKIRVATISDAFDIELPGAYLVNMAAESALKSVDGVTSVSEI
ncbi:DNA polymerase III subunit alpha [Roseibium sp. RKSG952]|uniref:DNA polymerase III subunit alpha n=1 Tax=Roseibium sp. RKSG952 TaxID=2529384 RepID=UPI0012BC2B1D|nr:DNA polymerase III subunit alpha [Roseibium sp. RKSG952]MTH96630.1 DNA polymerase III subunit alpha [Roseibium sp. RKSG952]